MARTLGRDEALSVAVAVAKMMLLANVGVVGGMVRVEIWESGVSVVYSLGFAMDIVE